MNNNRFCICYATFWHNVCDQIPCLPFFQSLMFACMCVASHVLFTIMLHVNIITLSEFKQTALKVEPHRSPNVNNAIFMCAVPSGSTVELNILSSFIPFFYLKKLSSDTTVSHYGSFKHIREEMSTMWLGTALYVHIWEEVHEKGYKRHVTLFQYLTRY